MIDYINDAMSLLEIKKIVLHTILEEEPLYDLSEIVSTLRRLGQTYTSFLQVKQEVME